MPRGCRHANPRNTRLKQIKSLSAFTLLLLIVQSVYSQSPAPTNGTAKTKIFLHSGWKFRQTGSVEWHPAIVPGCVHTDLLRNKMIDDPLYRYDEKKLQ